MHKREKPSVQVRQAQASLKRAEGKVEELHSKLKAAIIERDERKATLNRILAEEHYFIEETRGKEIVQHLSVTPHTMSAQELAEKWGVTTATIYKLYREHEKREYTRAKNLALETFYQRGPLSEAQVSMVGAALEDAHRRAASLVANAYNSSVWSGKMKAALEDLQEFNRRYPLGVI